MNNPDMLLSIKGDVNNAKLHLDSHYFPLASYKSSHGISSSTTLFLNLWDGSDTDSVSYFSVYDDSVTPITADEYAALTSQCIDDNCTLYNQPVPFSFNQGRYTVRL